MQEIRLPETDARWNLLERKVQRTNAARAYSLFEAAGIEPILIKGIAAAEYYPETIARRSVDLDLAVKPSDHAVATRIAASAADSGLAIDLHCGLRHLDSLPWDDLAQNSRLVQVEDVGRYRVLRPEDHLRVLSIHWLNDGGIYRDRLWDIYYLVANRDESFDWDRVTAGIGEVRRRWIEAVLGLCVRYCSLDLGDTPFRAAAETVPKWMIAEVEKAWADPKEIVPLWLVVRRPAAFIGQLRLRMAPNAIQATIGMEGSIDARFRFYYKAGNMLQRALPSLRRNVSALNHDE